MNQAPTFKPDIMYPVPTIPLFHNVGLMNQAPTLYIITKREA